MARGTLILTLLAAMALSAQAVPFDFARGLNLHRRADDTSPIPWASWWWWRYRQTTTTTATAVPTPTSSTGTLDPVTTTTRRDATPAPPPGTALTPDQQSYLSLHNSARQQHGAANLTWSDELAAAAQQWANGCKFSHSGGSVGPYGENLAAGTGSFTVQAAIKLWVDESAQYNPQEPVASHFTQVVWKSSNQLGCAFALCDGIFAPSFGKATFHVCEYSPPGNVVGQYAENVQP